MTNGKWQTINSRQQAIRLVSCLLILAYCFSPAFAQTDSSTTNVNHRINLSDSTTGGIVSVKQDSGFTFIVASSAKQPVKRVNAKRKFYWNDARYPTDDSSLAAKKLRRHSPLYAALFSMALPGLGQAYNKKYWKIPIVYAGLGGLGYACYYTASNFIGYRNAYRAQVATVPDHTASYKGVDDEATLKEYRDYFKKNLDISAICTGVWYILNIVDATVDAHLFDWNMKDDIHLSWQPVMISNYNYASATAPGVRISLSF